MTAAEPITLDDKARAYLLKRGLIDENVVGSARLRVQDDRLVIPWLDRDGREIYFQARSLNGAEPKYRNPAGVSRPALFASPGAHESTRIALVEGTLDALFGLQGGLSSFATAGQQLSPEAVAMIAAKDAVIVVADQDERGAEWLRKVRAALEGRVAELLVAELPEGLKDLGEVAEQAEDPAEAVAAVLSTAQPLARDPDLDRFLSGDDDEDYDWIVDGVIERTDRAVLTGREGAGKSYLIQQATSHISAGIHPFGDGDIAPVITALVDLENSARELRRRLRPIRIKLGARLKPDMMFVYSRPEGLDLGGSVEDRDWLRTRLLRTKAELLAIGPLYKMTDGNPHDEQDAKTLASYLDKLRLEFGIAVIVEAHMPHDGHGRPFGWSGWRRWPEVGLELRESGQLVHWRTPRHQTPSIPPALKRGGEWPFTPATNPRDVLWARIVESCAGKLQRPSLRDLGTVFGVSKSTVERALNDHQKEWKELFND